MFKKVLVLTLCLLLLTGAVLFAKAKHPNSMKAGPSEILNDTCYAKDIFSNQPAYYRPLIEPNVSYPFSNDTIGYTYYDYQFNDTQRRQIANDLAGNLHFTWMDLVGPDMTNNRYMDYNARYPDGTWLTSGGMHITPAEGRGGYGGLDVLPDNREVLFYHRTGPTIPAGAFWGATISIEDSTPGSGDLNSFDIPDSCDGVADKGEWPDVGCAKINNGDTVYIHITHAQQTPCGTKDLAYVRCFEKPGSRDTLVCNSPGWTSPLLIPKNTKLNPNRIPYSFASVYLGGAVVATSPVSHKVAIVWYRKWTASQTQNELMYVESTNDGSDWIASPSNFVPVQITNYQAAHGVGSVYAYDDIAAVYDYTDNLNIMWTTTPGSNALDVSLWHWDAINGIRKAGAVSASNVLPGAWNRLIAKFTLGVECMTGDPAYNYLYVNYTKFSDADIAADGYGDGDICTKASSNGGLTWGPEINLTNTNSNGCTAGNCKSEHWSSIAERVDSFLYVQYIYDLDAGGIPENEGTFTNNPVRFLKYPRFLVPPLAAVAYSPTQMTDSVRWAKNNQAAVDSLIVDNEWGTAALYVKLSGPPWLSISPSNFSILEGGFPQKVNLTFNAGGLADTFLVDSLRIISNNHTSGEVYSDTNWVRIHFVVTDSFYYPEFSAVNNGTMVTSVSNVGNLANQGDTTGMYYNQNDYLYDFSPVMCINIPGYGNKSALRFGTRNDFLPLSHLKVSQYPRLRSTVATSTFAPVSTVLPPPYHWFWWWYVLEEKEVFFWPAVIPPANPIHYERAILKTTKLHACAPPAWWSYVTSQPPTLPYAYLGFLADWDILYPYLDYTINTGGFDSTSNLIWIKGKTGSLDDHCGGVLFCCSSVDGDTSWTPFSARVIDNATQIDPFDGPNDDSLYKYMSTSGWSIESDPEADKSILVSAIHLQNPDPSTVVTMKYALMITDQGKADLDTLANQFRRAKCGDVSGDGKVTVSDIVFLVNYLFKGGPEPWLYYCDANGDCQVTVSDVVYLVNYLFKGGPQVKCDCGT